jgi:3-oxoacyl-[acyl-carrier-protein] synthase-1
MYRVAITGIGIISSIGNNIQTVAKALRLGKSGIVVDEKRKEIGFRGPLTGAIRDLF